MQEKVLEFTKTLRGKLVPRNRSYRHTFSSEEGKAVLADIYKFAGLDRPSYVEGCSDRMAYNEGMKRVAMHIKGILSQSDIDVDKLVADYTKSVDYDPFNQ